jgi:DNA-directed RNA polymerase specialized sigma24 family protein
MSSPASVKWSLDQRAFERLLGRLGPDGDAAAVEYETIRRKLVDFFGWRRVPWPEAQADETIDRVARKLDEGAHIEHLRGYFYGVARRILQEQQRRDASERAALETLRSMVGPAEPGEDVETRLACLEHCVGKLPPENRRLIVGYYEGAGRSHLEGRKRLAASLGISYATLKTRALRIRVSLARILHS